MPITEIVRVLASGHTAVAEARLFYDVDGAMGTDEAAAARPWFWVDLTRDGARELLGPFPDELAALEAGEAVGVTWD